ncbi:MAG: uracil-DNA glycosylase [Tenuifilum sp.]|uniref:uracil-DNA glycosylase n=1 Tax=Tenuifilum sp. TaxID=2760880 RepID=UPI001B4E6F1C|nr:uracil-DNA glycosylase [Bacteroidales bacterium]HOK60151.1 uracil-DNA glycosylase [Tenuifilum sp.]HOK85622.1 uracil-DNA glycosylase [Tenuifilum sp.]HOU74706.1 uracil-DNA glycosylase [Tenuifilum sp.]HPP89194.1 uracil-DNA glycosylase [Tenuifilum sp.]
MKPQIEETWKNVLMDEFKKDYFIKLKEFLVEEKKKYTVYPPGSQIFAAFNHTPFNSVKVVILGQDPYHGPGQAHGLCFSVPKGTPAPPSLQNIFKEINSDLGLPIPNHGNLEKWAKQGVLLLNATLTVRANQAGSHQNKGWETFTDAAIKALSDQHKGLVFILWGNYAQAKTCIIDTNKHFILTAPHPSPLSASRGFFGCKHFSKTNRLLTSISKEPIDWSLD